MTDLKHVFILGCHKSGTSLLRSLFDGHEDVFTVPIESHFFRLTGHWIEYPLKRSFPENMTIDAKYIALMEWINYVNEETNRPAARYSDSITKGRWDTACFSKQWHQVIDESGCVDSDQKTIIHAYVSAMYAALNRGRQLDKSIVVEKSVEHFEIAPLIKSYIPDAKFIHIVRNPYANLVSLRKRRRSFGILARDVLAIYQSAYRAKQYEQYLSNYRVVSYESLVRDPEKNIRDLSKFVGIPYSISMLTPTSLGDVWKGNSTSGTHYSRVSSAPIENWKSRITNLEIALVNELFGSSLESFDYRRIKCNWRKYLPCNREYPIAYILNRMFMIYLKTWNRRMKKQI